jgi:hypothetical protein
VRAYLHRFLLLLLMLALPLQALATASMRVCGTASHPAMAEQMAMADEAMANCHEPDQQPETPPAQHDCKHCAACALGAALPIPAADTPAVAPTPVRFLSHPAAPFSGFIPDGPERPPRISLA